MKFVNFRDHIWKQTKTDATSYPVTDMLLDANIYKDEIAQEILKQNEDYFILPATTDLVANQREYPFPANILNQIKAVELKFATADSAYVRANEVDLNDHKYTTDETSIITYFSNTEPKYDLIRGSLWLFSGTIVNAVAGIKLWFASYPAEFLDLSLSTEMEADPTTTTFGWPKPFHEILARRVIIAYKNNNGLPLTPDEQPAKYELDLQKALESIRSANLDRAVIAQVPANDGSNY